MGGRVMEMKHRGMVDELEIREINKKERTAEFVAATERGVRTAFGIEHLRIGGVNLTRFKANPVVLDSHNRMTVEAIVGRATVSREGRKLIVKIQFANTDRGQVAWQLVQDNMLGAVSVGFIPTATKELEEGEADGRGENRVEGPAVIVTEWELFEISVVPVPADAEALKRGDEAAWALMDLAEAISRKEIEMPKKKELEPQVEPQADPDLQVEPEPEVRAEPEPEPQPEPQPEPKIDARELEILKRDIMAITPRGQEKLAEKLILEGVTLEDARKALLEAHAATMQAVGTPEPPEPKKREEKPEVEKLDDDELRRMVLGR